MGSWTAFYARILGLSELHHFDDEAISTEHSALMSKVLADGDGRIKLPVNEPAAGAKRSQIDEYLDAYGGAGVQHLALATDDIVGTVRALRSRGVGFLAVPATYYDEARARVRRRQLPFAVRGLGAGTGRARQPVTDRAAGAGGPASPWDRDPK